MPEGDPTVLYDAVAELQVALGVSLEQAEDLASIQVECPVPGQEAASLSEFMNNPKHSSETKGRIFDTAKQALESGASPEEAMGRALGFAAIADRNTGKLLRVPHKVEAAPVTLQSSKKK